MHAVSDRYKQAVESGEYTNAYEMRFTPYGKDIAAMQTPVFKNYLASHVPDVLNARTAYAETLFECNTDRGGTMYFLSYTGIDTAARSSEYAKDDCTFDNPLSMTIDLTRADGTVIDYTTVGFSTACKNGNYAAEYQIVYYRGEQWSETVTYQNKLGISASAVKIPKIAANDCDKIKIIITKWCRPKVRSVISCVFIGAAPFVITNDYITTLPTTLKELESDDLSGVGSPSSNQFTFAFYDENNLSGESYAVDTKIDLACGIKTDSGQEIVPYGTYYITSGTKDNDIVSITAQDDLSDVMSGTKSDFVEKGSTLYCTYSDYITKLLPDIVNGLKTDDFKAALGDNSKGFKAVRGASMSDQCNEFCTLTGTCINYDDSGKKRLYQRYDDSAEVVAEYTDKDIIGSVSASVRTVPDIVKISVHTAELDGSVSQCFGGEKVEIPPFEIAVNNITDVDVDYENGDTVVNLEPYSDNTDDLIYSANATFRRELYDANGKLIDNSFVVNARGKYTYSKDNCIVRYTTFGRDKRTFAIDSHICPTRNISWSGNAADDVVSEATVDMSVYKGAAKWIFDWFKKTSVERKFQILTDFCLEVGDVVSVNGVRGVIYRIETDGTLSTITTRSEV